MRVLVIGGTGFIGPAVVRRMAGRGHEVTVFHRGVTHLVCDSAKIRDDLGYREVVSHQEAIERTVSWEREHPLREIDAKQFDYAAEDRILQEIA